MYRIDAYSVLRTKKVQRHLFWTLEIETTSYLQRGIPGIRPLYLFTSKNVVVSAVASLTGITSVDLLGLG